MILLAHPSGNTFFRAAARAFYSAGWLHELDSCVCWNPDAIISALLPASLSIELSRRSFCDVPFHLQHSYPWRECGRLLATAFQFPWFIRHERGPFSIDSVYRSFDAHIATRLPAMAGLQAVYAYEDSSLSTFKLAKDLGIKRIYDLPIGYWRSAQLIFQEERELLPEWSSTLTGLSDTAAKLARKDEELSLADLVIVPSEFVRETLLNHDATTNPIAVVPFGSPPPLASLHQSTNNRPIRVLYVGSLGQRKGLSYLLDAMHVLDDEASLTLIGRISSRDCQPLLAAINRHRWIPSLPHSKILEQMRQHDLLVLPSLFEGYALVISEALSQGLPVITTPNSGASMTVRDGIEGFIVPIRDSFAIADRITLLAQDRNRLHAMRLACLQRAEELSWSGYEKALQDVVGNLLNL